MGLPLLTNGDIAVLAANLLDKMVGHDSSTMELPSKEPTISLTS